MVFLPVLSLICIIFIATEVVVLKHSAWFIPVNIFPYEFNLSVVSCWKILHTTKRATTRLRISMLSEESIGVCIVWEQCVPDELPDVFLVKEMYAGL